MTSTFPYGNDLGNPDAWVGRLDTKSSVWLVSYENSFSIACGYHRFIFLGLESLSIGVLTLSGCGPSIEAPIGRLAQSGGGVGRAAARRFQELIGASSRAKDVGEHVEHIQTMEDISTGMQLYERMKEKLPTYVESNIPLSLEDIAGMPGAVAGAQVEAAAAAGQYFLEGYESFRDTLPPARQAFGPWTIANGGSGLIGAGIGGLIGVWSLGKWFNLYYELGATSLAQCHREGSSPAYEQPYMQIGNLHEYLRQLPPAGCNIRPDAYRPQTPWQGTHP